MNAEARRQRDMAKTGHLRQGEEGEDGHGESTAALQLRGVGAPCTSRQRERDVRESEKNGRREKRRDGREAHLVVNDDGTGQRRARGWGPAASSRRVHRRPADRRPRRGKFREEQQGKERRHVERRHDMVVLAVRQWGRRCSGGSAATAMGGQEVSPTLFLEAMGQVPLEGNVHSLGRPRP